MKLLKLLGLVALVTVPLAVLISSSREREDKEPPPQSDDAEDIFAAELQD